MTTTPSARRRGPQGPVAAYVSGVAALGAVALAVAAWTSSTTWSLDGAAVPLALIAVVSVLAPLRYQHGRGVQGFILDEGVLVAMLFVLDGVVPALVMTLATLVAHLLLRTRAIKLAFNVGQMALAATLGLVVFRLVGTGPEVLSARSVAAAMVAALAHNVVSSVALAGLFRRLEGRTVRETLASVWRPNAVTLVGNISFGLVLAVLARVDPAATLLGSTLLVGLYLGYRGYVGQLDERRRAEALHGFTRSLLTVGGLVDARDELFGRVAQSFGGQRVLLALEPDRGHLSVVAHPEAAATGAATAQDAGRRLVREVARRQAALHIVDGGPLSELLRSVGERDGMAAPVFRGDEVIGALVVMGRRGLEPWGDNHLTLLATMATELSVALENAALFQQVEEERARLEAESTKLNDILTAATDGIVAVRADGTIEAWNPGMARITGVDPTAAVGQPWHAVLRLKGEMGDDLAPTGDHVVSQAMAGGHAGASLSLQVLRADGAWRWVQCTSSPVRHPDGAHRGVVLVARDVTTGRELEDLKSDFIATVSHELRTPLTPLKGFLSTLRNPRTALTPDQLASVHGAMGSQLTRLETLISDLLAVAELDHGHFDLRPEPLDLSEVVTDAVQVEAADELSRCTLRIEPGVGAVADHVALVRIVRSLVSNALKHTRGHVEVAVRALEDDVVVDVRDVGPGIAPWDQQRVFNRFERLGNHLTRTQGPGLGLTIARSLALRMGGDVTLTSDVGLGATFTLRLPRARPRSLRLQAASEA